MAGQLFATGSLGGYYSSFNLSKELRMGVAAKSKWRQFCDIKDAWGKVSRTGETFTWDTVPTITRASRALLETATIPQAQHTIIQGTLTISERGLAVPYTGKLEHLAMFSVKQPIMKQLKQDAFTDLECMAWQQFNKTPLRYVSTSSADVGSASSLTTNSIATLTNTTLISKINVRHIIDTMKGRNIPPYTGDDYYGIARPASLRVLKNDMEGIHQYTPEGLTMIMNGEIGRYENCRFVEQTTVPVGGAIDTVTFDPFTNTGDAWDGSAGDWVFFCGEDTVAEAIETPEEIRAAITSDYGRSKGVAWYFLGGLGLAHGFGGANSAEARIVKYDSAA